MSTTVTITLVGFCGAMGHVTVTALTSGLPSRNFTFAVDELRESLEWGDAARVIRDLLRMHFRGLTATEARNELQAGITITI